MTTAIIQASGTSAMMTETMFRSMEGILERVGKVARPVGGMEAGRALPELQLGI